MGQTAAAVSSAEPDPEGVIMPKGLVVPKPSLESEDVAAQAVAAPTFAAPLVYVCDSTGRLATINLNTKVVKVIGKLGIVLTDMASRRQASFTASVSVSFTGSIRSRRK
ncbi:hypothetical protein HQ394_04220 [Defluviicoccus vanus]|uniref:Uncharacterized protein n=1 Tax=Defluviicoccus vanus TaxID=111831 RepID=A0A7H1MZ29_9PROT|nr:hypothetical protein HQ394_04220 [Defluviicoccus vanus]